MGVRLPAKTDTCTFALFEVIVKPTKVLYAATWLEVMWHRAAGRERAAVKRLT
jgi:hypothetical protein